MADILNLKPSMNIAQTLRSIADGYENGEYVGEHCTLIIGTDVFHLGTFRDDMAAQQAIWDMTYGIHKLMSPIFKD